MTVKVYCTKECFTELFYAGIKSETEEKIDSYFILNAFKVIFAQAMILNGALSAAEMH